MADENIPPFPPNQGNSSFFKRVLLVVGIGYVVVVAILWTKTGGNLSQQKSQWDGTPAPEFSVKTIHGETIALSDLKGKRVVLDMWATWCGPCVKEIPHFKKLAEENKENLVVLGVSQEDEATLKSFVALMEIGYPIASAELPPPFGTIEGYPTTFFIDAEGVIEHVAVGYHEYSELKQLALGK